MNIETELVEHLKNDTTLTSLVNKEVVPLLAQKKFPCIVYTVYNDVDEQSLDGKVYNTKVYVQIDCYAKDYEKAKEIKDAVKSALYEFKYFPYDFTSRALPEKETKLFRRLIEFNLNY